MNYPNHEIRDYIFDIFYSILDNFQNSAEWFNLAIVNVIFFYNNIIKII